MSTSTTTTGIRQIGLICVPTADQDRAIQFYESIGFEKRTDIAMAAATAGWRCIRPREAPG